MNNNNEKLNESRDTINKSVSKYALLGKSNSRLWNARRRYRTI